MAHKYEIERIDDKKLIISIPLDICKNCGQRMTFWMDEFNIQVQEGLRNAGIQAESYIESGICDYCIDRGGYSKKCDLCHKNYTFPQQFAFKLTNHQQYEAEADYTFICWACLGNKPQKIIDALAKADDCQDLRKSKRG